MKNHGTFVLNDTILLVVQYNKIRRTIALEPESKLKQRPTWKPTNNIYNRNKRKKGKTLRISLFQQDLPWKPKSFCPAMEEFN